MRHLGPIVCLASVAFGSGCSLVANGTHNLINEPRLAMQEHRFRGEARSLAREAWARQEARRQGASRDFRAGYLEGYADYLEGGRTTDPHPVPPERYRKVMYQTPATLRAVEEYAAGFQAGAGDALSSGQRQRLVTPVLVPVGGAAESVPVVAAPAAESLPPPRKLPEGASPSR